MKLLRTFFLILASLLTFHIQAEENVSPFNYIAVGDVPDTTMQEIEATLNARYKRIVADYQVTNLPVITVKIWQDREAFESSYGENAKFVHGYVVDSSWEIRFFNGRPQVGLGVVHEFTHLVTVALNPSFNNNPRWLWEATAIFESERPPVPDVRDLKCFSERSFPTLESLDSHPFNIYKVGFYLADFIISKWGREGLVGLVLSNGNIKSSLNMESREFEKQWLDYMKQEHGLKPSATYESDC